ncbi:TIGR02221 family CRISPR-associated protein [Flectobacillus roseus]
MGRKVFISFLGYTNYEPVKYAIDDKDAENAVSLRFIQEATLLQIQEQFNAHDKVFILTTDGALKNWYDGKHQNFKTKELEFQEGLNSRLEKMNLQAQYKNIEIKDGKDTDEIWSIFNVIFNLLHENDELFFDITHGFRTLPMLNMVLINYAKLLKNVTVSGIFYGAYEAKKRFNDIEYAPIWNLKPFVDLQDWTNSANIFLKTGNAIELTTLIQDERYTLLKENLSQFSKQLLVNRGLDIFSGDIAMQLNEQLHNIEHVQTPLPALTPILTKIKNEFSSFQKDSAINGFLAVRWCIQNGLIQQAATLLEEFITTFVMTEIGEYDSIKNIKKRETISAALKIGTGEPFKYIEIPELSNKVTEEYQNICKEILSWQVNVVPIIRNLTYKKKIGVLLFEISKTIRNDINHGGFRDDAKSFDGFESSIKKRYNETRKLIKQIKQIDLPDL